MKRIILLMFVLLPYLNSVQAQEGSDIYNKTCAACHTIGGGRLIGPDLLGVEQRRSEEWIGKFILSSQSVIKSGDADAKAIFEKFNKVPMPDNPLSDLEIQSVISYIKSFNQQTGAGGTNAAPIVVVDYLIDATDENVEKGKDLFTGNVRFENKGATCISCHNIKNEDVKIGGSLAKDLSYTYSTIGSNGIKGIISASPFPAMKASYQNNPLTEEEVYNLTAFLRYADQEKLYQVDNSIKMKFIYSSIFLFLGLIILIRLVWLKRKSESVNKLIHDRQISAEK